MGAVTVGTCFMNPPILPRHPTDQDYASRSRYQSPEAVRLALAAYDASLNSILSMTAVRDADDQVVDFLIQSANRSVARSLGMTPDQIIGTRLLDTFPGNVESGLFALYKRVVDAGVAEQTTQYYNDANGLDAWFEVSAVWQKPDGVVLTFVNITESKQAELEIQRQAELLQTVLNSAQAAISLHAAIRDGQDRIVDFRTITANQQAMAMWGDWAEPILTKTFFEVASPEQQAIDFPKYVRVVDTGEPDQSEFNIGDEWWLRVTARSGDGVVISNVNISENRRYREQLEAANAALKRSNENLQSFAYVASHDLQEPLRKIQAFGGILKERYGPTLGTEGADMIDRMQLAAERMSLLIRDLLDYSRIASQPGAFRPFSLTKLIDDIVEDLWHPIHQTGARIDIGALPDLTGDRPQLRQLFQNLLSNALKFHRIDGAGAVVPPVVRVSTDVVSGHQAPDAVCTELVADRQYCAISVTDNGTGFEQKHAGRIFEVFQRLHGRQYDGTGIGLAVAKKVVGHHDGAIDVVSEVGVGTTFTVYLPV